MKDGIKPSARLSPHTWGCSVILPIVVLALHSCPHIRGGVPQPALPVCAPRRLSPHTWGCSGSGVSVHRRLHRCPHIRGGVPKAAFTLRIYSALSPHTWGCSSICSSQPREVVVVPTYVGVFRSRNSVKDGIKRCPHIRGGVPETSMTRRTSGKLSPHTWGCSYHVKAILTWCLVVPTYVGVFLQFSTAIGQAPGCPHIRGGVPYLAPYQPLKWQLSPHTWGCSY